MVCLFPTYLFEYKYKLNLPGGSNSSFLAFFASALDPSKDPCLKVKCSPHKVCVTQDYQTALCVSRKHLLPR